MRLINLGNILWDGVVEATCQDFCTQGWAEVVGMVKDHLLQAGERNFARSWILVAKVILCNNFSTLHKGADNLHAYPTTEAKVSDRNRGVQEDNRVCRDVLDDREVGGLCQLLDGRVSHFMNDRAKCHEGTVLVSDLKMVSVSNVT